MLVETFYRNMFIGKIGYAVVSGVISIEDAKDLQYSVEDACFRFEELSLAGKLNSCYVLVKFYASSYSKYDTPFFKAFLSERVMPTLVKLAVDFALYNSTDLYLKHSKGIITILERMGYLGKGVKLEILKKFFSEGMTYKEIADSLSAEEGWVKDVLFVALNSLDFKDIYKNW